jgi:hypothetical protein
MVYDEVRSTFQTGDIIAISRDQLRSWHDIPGHIIRLFTRSEYSHVGMVWVIGERVFLVESVTPLVRIIPLSNLKERGFYHVCIGKDFSASELQYIVSTIGASKYSRWQAILAYFKRLKIGADDKFECAELVIAARRLSGVQLGNVATPSAVVKRLLEQGYKLQYVQKA